MISDELFGTLVAAATRAPSADNMQAWAFSRDGDTVVVALEPSRVLPTDVRAMFAWVGLGAAVENLVIAAEHEGYAAEIDDTAAGQSDDPHVTVRLLPIGSDDPLAAWIDKRETNRGPFDDSPLERGLVDELTASVKHLDAGLHWLAGARNLRELATLDAHSTYLRLEHRPLHDELFSILRFSRAEIERTRYGLEFESIGVPFGVVWLARLLRYPSVMQVVGRLGIGRLVARQQAARLRTAAALCLVTARRPGPAGYVEAGRAMERLWLAANAHGLAVQPHGVLPLYLTKLDVEPETFGPRYAAVMAGHREPFHLLFPGARSEHPAIVLRLGRPLQRPTRRSLRLPLDQVVRQPAQRLRPR